MDKLIHLTDLSQLPLSSSQKRLWIIYLKDRFNPAYNIEFTYHIEGDLDREVIQKSLNVLFNRQHTMFSVFRQNNGNPYCQIIPGQVDVAIEDLSMYKELAAEKAYTSIEKDIRTPFDLETGPLYRLYLYKLDNSNYFFHVTISHLIFDAGSVKLFVTELGQIYNNLLRKNNDETEPLKYYSYDFAKQEESQQYIQNESQLVSFWKENLKNCPVELKFPFDRPRKGNSTGLGHRVNIEISGEDTRKLKDLSEATGSTVFSIMLSVLAILLKKYTGEDEVCIGIPVSSRRDDPELNKIFGLFINTTVVRLNTGGNKTIKEYLSESRSVIRSAIKNSLLPFDKIVEAVNPERVPNINPLFQVALSSKNQIFIPLQIDNAKGECISVNEGVSPFDLTFYLGENGEKLELDLDYNIDILEENSMIRLKSNLLTLIRNILCNPDSSIDSLTMLSEGERDQILEFAGKSTDYPKGKTISELFEEQVILNPDRIAVVFKDASLTYLQLNERSNMLARTLRSLDVKRNTPVSIMADKSTDMIVGILGILKAGGAYVPIDPLYPDYRIKYIIKDSGSRILLTQDKYMEFEVEGIKKLILNSHSSYETEKSDLEKNNNSSDMAHILYTSGTTGIPKGSVISHFNVVRLIRETNYIKITSDDRFLFANTIVFDAATFEIWGSLLNGGSLYIAEKETILDPVALGKELIKNEITILLLTSSLFTHIAEIRTDIFGKLKYLLVGGDVLSAQHINKVRNDNPNLNVLNVYGPTENTTFSTTYLIKKDFENNIPIGKPVSNSTAYIFDKNLNYQPIGVIGELYVGGDGVSLGYLNNDDLNRKSFLQNPNTGERIYKTGDYAKWLPDGNIEFHGRIDNQLKIRGFRVELGEIESVISEIEGINETVVKPVNIDGGQIMLAAFLNVSDSFRIDEKELGRVIKQKLPSYMIPSSYKFMKGFPKTINGKTDRKSLNADTVKPGKAGNSATVNMTSTERIIYNIWCDSLKTKDISLADNFFEHGGNSLLAITVFSRIESAFNTNMSLRVFFDSPRIKDLGEAIEMEKMKMVSNNPERDNRIDSRIIKGEI